MATSGAVAVFINTMTGSETLVGLAISLQVLCMLVGQIIYAPFVHSVRNLPMKMFYRMGVQRLLPFVMSIPLFLGAGPHFAVGAFMIVFGLFWLIDGVITMLWGELTARAIRPELRGHMMGMQVVIGGGISLLTGLLLTWLLATPLLTDNYRFGYVFVLSAALFFPSIMFIRLVKDPKPILAPKKPDFKKYYSQIPRLIRESKPLQLALIARMPSYIGFSVITFMIVFGSNELEITEAQISWLVYTQIAGVLLGGVIVGETSRRFGNKSVIMICNIGVLVTILMALILMVLPGLGYFWLIALCIFASVWSNNWIGYMNYVLDISPEELRPAYQLVVNCVGIPFSLVGFGIGALIDTWGYAVAFILGGITTIIAIIASTRLLSRKQIRTLDLET